MLTPLRDISPSPFSKEPPSRSRSSTTSSSRWPPTAGRTCRAAPRKCAGSALRRSPSSTRFTKGWARSRTAKDSWNPSLLLLHCQPPLVQWFPNFVQPRVLLAVGPVEWRLAPLSFAVSLDSLRYRLLSRSLQDPLKILFGVAVKVDILGSFLLGEPTGTGKSRCPGF